jgi:hypothetical protein
MLRLNVTFPLHKQTSAPLMNVGQDFDAGPPASHPDMTIAFVVQASRLPLAAITLRAIALSAPRQSHP